MKTFLIFLAGAIVGWYLHGHQGQVRSVAHQAKSGVHDMTSDAVPDPGRP